MPTTPSTQFGNIPLGTVMATAAETAAIASEAAQTAVASITDDLQDLVARTYKYVGSAASIAAITYPSGKTKANGDVWNITGAFTLDGVDYPAGTDVAWIADASETGGGHWNALGGRTFDDSGVLEGVKLAGASSALTPSNKIVTIPDAVATGQTGATNGLMTAADKAKLNGVAAGAQVNTIETVKVNGTALTPTNKAVNIPKATGSVFGAVELSDATDGTAAAASGGTAATPKAVADALTAAKAYADALPSGGVTSVNGETGSVLIYGNTLVMGNGDSTIVSTAIDNAISAATNAGADAAARIRKATVKGKIDTPPATLANLPANAASLTLNQILNALYAGASESES